MPFLELSVCEQLDWLVNFPLRLDGKRKMSLGTIPLWPGLVVQWLRERGCWGVLRLECLSLCAVGG